MKRTRQNKDQRELRDRFRVFAQFYSFTEFQRLLGSMEREKQLNVRLSELHRYRWNGLTRVDECVHFEQHTAAAQQRNTGPFGHGRTVRNTPLARISSQLFVFSTCIMYTLLMFCIFCDPSTGTGPTMQSLVRPLEARPSRPVVAHEKLNRDPL